MREGGQESAGLVCRERKGGLGVMSVLAIRKK